MKKVGFNLLFSIYSSIFEILRFSVNLLSRIFIFSKWNLRERQNPPRLVRDIRNRTVVWVHAASLGEAKVLLKFLELLVSRHPEDLYLLTAASPTGVKFLEENRRAEVCAVGFLPLDTIPLMNKMLDRFKVSRIWLVETELWPSMLWCCREKRIPVGIVNGRLEERSYKNMKRLDFLFRPLFNQLDIVLVQDEIYSARFQELGVNPDCVHVIGNLKSHVTVRRPDTRHWISIRKKLNIDESVLLLTAGCIHPGEASVIRESFEKLRELGLPCRCIVVPRHLEAVPALIQELGDSALLLKDIETDQPWDLCVIEKMGILDDMYRIADAAIVGGSFVKVGGHNVWDPARFGIPVFFGPETHAQKESCERLVTSGVGFRVQDGSELGRTIYKVMKTEASRFVNAQILFAETVNKSQSILEPLIP